MVVLELVQRQERLHLLAALLSIHVDVDATTGIVLVVMLPAELSISWNTSSMGLLLVPASGVTS